MALLELTLALQEQPEAKLLETLDTNCFDIVSYCSNKFVTYSPNSFGSFVVALLKDSAL